MLNSICSQFTIKRVEHYYCLHLHGIRVTKFSLFSTNSRISEKSRNLGTFCILYNIFCNVNYTLDLPWLLASLVFSHPVYKKKAEWSLFRSPTYVLPSGCYKTTLRGATEWEPCRRSVLLDCVICPIDLQWFT